jgi:hypothetical protein
MILGGMTISILVARVLFEISQQRGKNTQIFYMILIEEMFFYCFDDISFLY